MGCDIHLYLEQRNRGEGFDGKVHWSHLADLRPGRNYRLFALMAGVRMRVPPWRLTNEYVVEFLIEKGLTDEKFETLTEEQIAAVAKELLDSGITCGQPPFEPKGITHDMNLSSHVEWEFTLYVREEKTEDEGSCSREDAERWLKNESSEVWEKDDEGKVTRVTHPDWHTPSWLSTQEVETLVRRFAKAQEMCLPECKKEQAAQEKMFEDLADKEKDPEKRKEVKQNSARFTRWENFDPMRDEQLAYMRGVLAFMKALETPEQPCRILFWFDN